MKCLKHPGPAKVYVLIHQFRVSFYFLPLILRVVMHVSFFVFYVNGGNLVPKSIDCFIRTTQSPHDVIGILYIVAVPVLFGLYRIVSLALARTCLQSFFFCLVYFCDNVDAQYFSLTYM